MIELRSDTQTKPSEAMRQAAADAAVGDDDYGEDPTVNELEDRVADLLGTADALYFPSGTMANQTAVRVHTDRGQEVVLDERCHLLNYETNGLVQHAAVQPRSVDGGDRGVPSPRQIHDAYVPDGSHNSPGTGLLALENTHNARGGLAIAPDRIDEAAETAADLGVPTHLDGARLWNAAVAHDVPVDRFTEHVDSVMCALSKGLGAPVGSVLGGDEAFVAKARRVRKLMGGGMRQAGIVAAPGLEALGNVDRLREDHENARALADGLEPIDRLAVTPPETNIVIADVSALGLTSHEVLEKLKAEGVLASEMGEYAVRFVTHWDVDREDVDAALEAIQRAL